MTDNLSTPTSQPPAAETRLREAESLIRELVEEGMPSFMERSSFQDELMERAQCFLSEAALTQPELAAQQGDEERARKLLADLDALLGKPIRTGPVAEEAFKLILAALSSQQAAGEAEADIWAERAVGTWHPGDEA